MGEQPFLSGDAFSIAEIAVAPHVMAATFLGFSPDPTQQPNLARWMDRVQWRSDRLEWVMKNGFADWFAEEMRSGRAFFPLSVRQ